MCCCTWDVSLSGNTWGGHLSHCQELHVQDRIGTRVDICILWLVGARGGLISWLFHHMYHAVLREGSFTTLTPVWRWWWVTVILGDELGMVHCVTCFHVVAVTRLLKFEDAKVWGHVDLRCGHPLFVVILHLNCNFLLSLHAFLLGLHPLYLGKVSEHPWADSASEASRACLR